MDKPIQEYDLSRTNFSAHEFSHEDLCIVGVPSYGGRVPSIAIERLKLLKGNQTPVILVVTYGNRHYDDTFIELKDTLDELGFICEGAVAVVCEHSIVHDYAKGRPNQEDYQHIQKLVETLKNNLHPIEVPGHRPYKEFHGGLKPKATSQCTKCGLCAKLCPVEALIVIIYKSLMKQNAFHVCVVFQFVQHMQGFVIYSKLKQHVKKFKKFVLCISKVN